ncbi:MAG: TolC family protein [bacterium]|nr:TolC family protein [bacterium]
MTTLLRIWPLLLIVALLQVAPAAAAEQELSLEEAVRIAQENSHRLNAARQGVAIAAGGERVAKAELMPELSAMGTWLDYDGDVFYARFINPAQPGQPNPTAPPTDASEFSTTQMGVLKLTQPLYTGGAVRSRLRASRVERQLAEQGLRRQQLELTYEVTQAYYGVLLAEQAAEVARQSVRRSEETLRAVRQRRAAEEALKVEELGAESHLALDRHRLLKADNDVRFARLALGRLLAGEPTVTYRLTDSLEAPAKTLDEEQAVSETLAQQPAVEEAKLRLTLAEAMHAAARSHFKPKLALEGYYSWIDSETFFEGTNYGAALNLSIPFLKDITAGAGEVDRAAARRELESSSLQETLSAIRLQARQAVRQVEEAYSTVEVIRQALAYEQEKHRVTESAFREGLVTAEDMLDEHTELAEAELELYGALYQARLREAELEKVLGR